MSNHRIEYDHNKPVASPWATYVPRRNPMFKVHASRGLACNAINNGCGGILYKHDGQKWIEFFNLDNFKNIPNRDNCFNCDKSLVSKHESRYGSPWISRVDHKHWIHKEDSSTVVFLCDDCWRNRRYLNVNSIQWGDGE